MAYEMSHKIVNTAWLQVVFAALLVAGISLFHNSLHQVVIVLITLMSSLLVAVSLPFLGDLRSGEPAVTEEAA